MTNEIKSILKLIIISVAIAFIIGFIYNLGYNKAVKSAYLVSVNENTHNEYVIAFGDEANNYSGDWKEVYTK